jgi:hypothetical protein
MAGYSTKSLKDKLGIRQNTSVLFLNQPPDYAKLIGPLDKSIGAGTTLHGEFDFIHYFAKNGSQLSKEFAKLKKALAQSGIVWISWPKKTSSIEPISTKISSGKLVWQTDSLMLKSVLSMMTGRA